MNTNEGLYIVNTHRVEVAEEFGDTFDGDSEDELLWCMRIQRAFGVIAVVGFGMAMWMCFR